MLPRILGVLLLCLFGVTIGQPDDTRPAKVGDSTKAPVRLDSHGDPLPPGALWRLGSIRLNHGRRIDTLRFSRDGKVLFSHTHSTRLRAWDVVSGKEMPLPFLPAKELDAIAFSPEGRLLALAEVEGDIHVCDLQTLRILRRWSANREPWSGLAVSADGRLVAWMDEKQVIHVRDLETDKDRLSLRANTNERAKDSTQQFMNSASLAFSPDGKLLASADGTNGVLLWSLEKGKKVRRYATPAEGVPVQLHFVDKGHSLLTVGRDGAARIWELDLWEERSSFEEGDVDSTGLALLPDGKTLAAVADNEVRLWSLVTGKMIRTLTLDAEELRTVAFSSDSKVIATGNRQGHIRFWDAATGKSRPPVMESEAISTAGFDSTGKEIIIVGPTRIRRWASDTGKRLSTVALVVPNTARVSLSPDGNWLALVDHPDIRLFDTRRGQQVVSSQIEGARWIANLVFFPDSRHLVVATEQEKNAAIHILNSTTGRQRLTLELSEATRDAAVALSPDGRTLYIVRSSSHAVERCELATGQFRQPLWLPGAAEVSAGPRADSRLRLRYSAHFDVGPDDLRLLMNGALLRLVVGGGSLVPLEDSDDILAHTFSPDSELLAASSSEAHLRRWDVRTGRLLARLAANHDQLSFLTFSPDGKRLFTAGEDGAALLWDVAVILRLAKPKSKPVVPRRPLEALWADLSSDDAAVAEKAQRQILTTPTASVGFLARRLRPATVDAALIARLITDLDSDIQNVREQASKQLAGLDELAEAALRKAAKTGSAEVKREANRLLERIERFARTGPEIRPLRAVEVLEKLGTPAARKLLTELSRGAPEARLTREAHEALRRLSRRISSEP